MPPLRKWRMVHITAYLHGYFQKLSHGKGTRGDDNKLLLPKVKTETARKRFAFQGAVLYNKLPVSFYKRNIINI